MSCSDIRRTFISRFSANGKSFSRLREIFCSGAPALPGSPSRKSSRIVLRMICAERTSPIKEAQENAGESHQSKNLRGSGGNLGSGCEGGRSAHALLSWRNLLQPVRHAFNDGACPRGEKHQQTRRPRHDPLFWVTPFSFCRKTAARTARPHFLSGEDIRRTSALPRTTGPFPCLPACPRTAQALGQA